MRIHFNRNPLRAALPALSAFLVTAGLLLILPGLAAPADAQFRGQYESYAAAGGCIGGELCEQNGDALEIRLDGQPVQSIRFRAHDDVGNHSGGRLRVSLGDEVLAPSLEVPREGDFFTFDARGSRARVLTFEATSNDEVVIEDIEVLYVSGENTRGAGDWRDYEVPETCIGGSLCPDNFLEVRLDARNLEAVRFRAHDNVGNRHNGRLRVLVDDHVLEPDLRVARDGDVYSLDARGLTGRTLRFETLTDDEIVVEDLRVLYADPSRATDDRRRGWRRGSSEERGWTRGRGHRDGGPGNSRNAGRRSDEHNDWGDNNDWGDDDDEWEDARYENDGARNDGYEGDRWDGQGRTICIGGGQCGRNGSTHVVRLDEFPVNEIRFRAHDNVGNRHNGRLTVSIDGRVLAEDLDIPQTGETFTLNARGVTGRELLFEVASDDEVVIEDVRVDYQTYRRIR